MHRQPRYQLANAHKCISTVFAIPLPLDNANSAKVMMSNQRGNFLDPYAAGPLRIN